MVYLPDREPHAAIELIAGLDGCSRDRELSPALARMAKSLVQRSSYSAMMRFALQDPDERRFSAERWCFRGSYDNWWLLAAGAPLKLQLDRFIPHLDQESFFELL